MVRMARQPGEYELDDDDDGGDGRIAPYVPLNKSPSLAIPITFS